MGYIHSERELFNALKMCRVGDLGCRIDIISHHGLAGLEQSFGSLNRNAVSDPFASLEALDYAMKSLGVVLKFTEDGGDIFKSFGYVNKFQLETLKVFGKSIQKHWGSVEFVRWATGTLTRLQFRLNEYFNRTGFYDGKRYLAYFRQLSPEEERAAIARLKMAGTAIYKFDVKLTNDISTLFDLIDHGLDVAMKSEPSQSVFDSFFQTQMATQLTWMHLSFPSGLAYTLRTLNRHRMSWGWVVDTDWYWERMFAPQLMDLKKKMAKTIQELFKKAKNKKKSLDPRNIEFPDWDEPQIKVK